MTQPRLNNLTESFIPHEALNNKGQHENDVDLNDVLQFVLEKYRNTRQNDFIMRFDTLPLVEGNKDHFVQMFDSILFMITSHPPVNSKLFLYIKCSEEKQNAEVMDLRKTADKPLLKIDFFTNIHTDDNWQQIYESRLAECYLRATQNGGSFAFYPISNTGCLFSVLRPGKI